jgi:energy-coupling factor transporter ATP-binding protein EcfA2
MPNSPLITRIRVVNLFGLYTYTLPRESEFSDAVVLYGDNGVGKSTVLRLVFHMLSSADNKGHRTALLQGDFELLQVELQSGVFLSAEKVTGPPLGLLFKISKNDELVAEWTFYGDHRSDAKEEVIITTEGRMERRRIIRSQLKQDSKTGHIAYMAALKQHAPSIYILNAERRLYSDGVADPSDEVELRRLMHFEEPTRINDLLLRSREIGLSQALNTTAKWFSQKAVIGANQGSVNVHSTYVQILKQLTSQPHGDIEQDGNDSDLPDRLKEIERKVSERSAYELSSVLDIDPFVGALSSGSMPNRKLAAGILKPYVNSLEARLAALEPVYHTLDRFVKTLNIFLNDKTISFTLSKGFMIIGRRGNVLEPGQLSSGEQQLLLLFCYAVVARETPSVFMIDEPELSLNIKWQRQLINSLLAVTEGAPIQFILASHSLELLAQHRDRVVQLVNENA